MAPNIISLCEFWLKLFLYVENFMKKALLNILHNVNNKKTYKGLPSDPTRLYNELRNHHTKLTKLKSKKIISDDQWLLLFPDNQQTDSAEFDITLIVLLVINCTTLPSPNGGWRQKCPSITDMSVGAFVLRAREFRNKIAHYSNPITLKESEFTTIWLEGDQILNGLEYVIDTETLKHKSLDPERMDYFRLLLNHLQNGQNQLQRLVDEHTTDISNLSDLVIEIKEKISRIAVEIETLIKEVNIKQSNVLYINYTLLKARIFWCQKKIEESLSVLVESNKIATEYNLHYQRVCILMNIGKIYIVKGDYQNALKEINNAIDVLGESDRGFSHISIFFKGLILLLLNRLNEAFEELLKIINDIPVSAYARIFGCASKYDRKQEEVWC